MGYKEAWCLFIFSILLLILIFAEGCATSYPTRYHQIVLITGGIYRGEKAELIGDCPGIENYKVKLLFYNVTTCVRVFNMEAVR